MWRVMLVTLLVGIAAFTEADAQTLPRVVVTVDVESKEGLGLPYQVDTVCEDGSKCGLMEIARLLQERNIGGTFFLNVYEYKQWGEDSMRTIARHLQDLGQDVSLHTHPQWAYDPDRNLMHQYTLEEQTRIVRDGAELLANWTGKPVVAHRAGAYGADERTLEALVANGILVDSSYFWRYPLCKLENAKLARNMPSFFGDLLEIPVTVFERVERPALFGAMVPGVTSIRKMDPDWLAGEAEAEAAWTALKRANLPFIVVFLHSYSFLGEAGENGARKSNGRARELFQWILDAATKDGLEFVTMRDIAQEKQIVATARSQPDRVPTVAISERPDRYFWHLLKTDGNGKYLVIGLFFVGVLMVASIVFVKRRPGS